jgi:hypothetical protein
MMPIAGGTRFRAALTVAGGTAGFVVPPEVITDLGGGPAPKVVATVHGHRFSTAIQSWPGRYWMAADPGAVAAAGVGAVEVVVEVELDLPVRATRAWRPGRRARPGYPRRRRP